MRFGKPAHYTYERRFITALQEVENVLIDPADPVNCANGRS
jgi:hypothetical protein